MLNQALAPESRILNPEPLRGKLRQNVLLAKRCWFQVGGEADWLFIPEDVEDLQLFMRQRSVEMPLYILGVGSNLLVRDGGLRGTVLRLGGAFAGIQVLEERGMEQEAQSGDCASHQPAERCAIGRAVGEARGAIIKAGAAALDINVANATRDAGIGGLEFLCGIPGTIGGAVAMNAGAYGREIKDVLESAEVVDIEGNVHQMTAEELGFTYRHSSLPEGWVCTSVVLRGVAEDKEVIAERMQKIMQDRETSQPVKARTGGSTFQNPAGEKKAWQLIDEAGCRGLTIGDAQVSEKHCNFLINRGAATAAELEELGEEVRRRVLEKSGIALEWEIKRIGEM